MRALLKFLRTLREGVREPTAQEYAKYRDAKARAEYG